MNKKATFSRKAVRFLLSSLLCLSCILSVILPVTAAGGTKIPAFTASEGDKSYHAVAEGSVYGVRLNLGAEFNGFAFCMPTNGSRQGAEAELRVYAWEGDFETTVGSAPAAASVIKDLRDCATNWVYFDPLPAGEYLFTIENVVNQTGTWFHTATGVSCAIYEDGILKSKGTLEITVSFPGVKPDTPFKEISEELSDYGKHATPEPYVIPEDSLIYTHEVLPDTWVFTDGLGRVSLTYDDVGGIRDGKTVAVFYTDWHEDMRKLSEPFNVNDFMLKYPEAKNDYRFSEWPKSGIAYFWNTPIWGYYSTADEWVLRRQAELLADAGVDVIFNDNTNGNFTWRASYLHIFEAWSKAMTDGVRSPKISFLLPFGPTPGNVEQQTEIYLDIYRRDRYPELWFWWDEKPMLMGFQPSGNGTDKLLTEINNFFTFRAGQPSYLVSGTDLKTWGWLSTYPQAVYYTDSRARRSKAVEQMTVGIAVNHNYVSHEGTAMNGENVMGRSYTSAYPDRYDKEGPDASLWGYNFSEQFDYALQVDPELIFVTGWNEWTAGRQEYWGGVENAFADEFTDEFSRDIEPTRGALRDNYYYLLVNYVRRYKGCHEMPAASEKKTVDIHADPETSFADVGPYYAAYIGNTGDRDGAGYGTLHYTDRSGRNDIVGAKLARDDSMLYFMIECADTVTSPEGNLWMNLYIDTDADGAYNGWESFDYVIGKTPADTQNGKVTLEKFTGNGYGSQFVSECDFSLNGRYLLIAVPKDALGLDGDEFTVNFSVTDNVHDADDTGETVDGVTVYSRFSGDILDFYTSGDVAPGGRFKFAYTSHATVPDETDTGADTDTETDTTADVGTDDGGTSAAPVETSVPSEPGETGTNDGTEQTGADAVSDTGTADSDGCASRYDGRGFTVCLLLCAAVALCLFKKKGYVNPKVPD